MTCFSPSRYDDVNPHLGGILLIFVCVVFCNDISLITGTSGSQLWEADIAPVKGAESALPPPSAALPYKEEKEEETTAYDSEMSAEDLLDYLLSFMLSH
mmetsp:Transcript_36792/g.62015  ORF Transcript_36792/g.62015 Transcript_36792/m.62015 type:complete len:99 (-) Transcript_36792:520-816(-)